MPLFICDVCTGIDNTAFGAGRRKFDHKYTGLLGTDHVSIYVHCKECMSPEYGGGAWHGEFTKRFATEEIVRERGLWPYKSTGFIHLGPFEYLRPEIEKTYPQRLTPTFRRRRKRRS